MQVAPYCGCLSVIIMSACGSADHVVPAFSSDSSAVEVIENVDPIWGSAEAWTMASQPWLLIGQENEERLRFNRIRSVFSLSDGSVAVANGGPPPELRIFDTDGRLLTVMGGAGEGPGEFRSLQGAWLLPSDTILALDNRLLRLTVFDRSGAVVRTEPAPNLVKAGMAGFVALDRFEDGSWLLLQNVPTQIELDGERKTRRLLVRARADTGAIDTVASFHEVIKVREGREWEIPLFFPGVGVYVTGGTRLYAGYPHKFEIDVLDLASGQRRRIRRQVAPRELTGPAYNQLIRAQLATAPADRRAALERRLASRERPRSLPAFGASFAVDTDGSLWVQSFVVPGDQPVLWSVFEPSGRYLGQVSMPSAFRPIEIRRDRILGVWRDSFDVESVRGYDLDRRGRSTAALPAERRN
jgi:hypothetical protein